MEINLEKQPKKLIDNDMVDKFKKMAEAFKRTFKAISAAVKRIWDFVKIKVAIAYSNEKDKAIIVKLQKIKNKTKSKRIKKKLDKRIFKMVFNN